MAEILKGKIRYIVIGVILLVIIPFIVELAIIDNNWVSKASSEGWASFFGSYLGGILGGMGTLVAVLITTNQTRIIQEEQKQYLSRKDSIDKQNRDEERVRFNLESALAKERFEKEFNIRILNEKINDYKERFNLVSTLCFMVSDFIKYESYYNENVYKFKELGTKFIYLEIYIVDPKEKEKHNEIKELFYNEYNQAKGYDNLLSVLYKIEHKMTEYIETITQIAKDLVAEKYNL